MRQCSRRGKCPTPQPEGEVSDPQPETALTALIGGNQTVKDVSSESDLTAAIDETNVNTVKLAGDIIISSSLTVRRTVTLDLNGHVLKYESANEGSVIVVEGGGNLTLTDSNDEKVHRFNKSVMPWALAADDATGENFVDVSGGVITGGTGTDLSTYGGTTWYCGGGALIKGLDRRLNEKTGIPFHIAEDPLRAIARGTGIALKNINRFPFLMK